MMLDILPRSAQPKHQPSFSLAWLRWFYNHKIQPPTHPWKYNFKQICSLTCSFNCYMNWGWTKLMLTQSRLSYGTSESVIKAQIYRKWNFNRGEPTEQDFVAYVGWSLAKPCWPYLKLNGQPKRIRNNWMSSTSIKPQLLPEFRLIPSEKSNDNQTSDRKVVSILELIQKQS